MIRINDKWVILIDGDHYTVAEDHNLEFKLKQVDGTLVFTPRYIERQSYSTLHAAINGICNYMTIRELRDNDCTLSEALQITHDLYTMVNDSVKEALRGK